MGQFMGIGKQSKDNFSDGMITLENNEKHDDQMVVSREFFYISLAPMLLRYFSNLTFVNER